MDRFFFHSSVKNQKCRRIKLLLIWNIYSFFHLFSHINSFRAEQNRRWNLSKPHEQTAEDTLHRFLQPYSYMISNHVYVCRLIKKFFFSFQSPRSLRCTVLDSWRKLEYQSQTCCELAELINTLLGCCCLQLCIFFFFYFLPLICLVNVWYSTIPKVWNKHASFYEGQRI